LSKVVGIICGSENEQFTVKKAYVKTCQSAGTQVIILPSAEKAEERMPLVDGIVLAGGPDVDPAYYRQGVSVLNRSIDPWRDRFEIDAVRYCLNNELPVLAICRGIQVLNVALGGDLYQDIYAEYGSRLQHEQKAPRWYGTHSVELVSGTLLQKAMGESKIRVNSFHHQALHRLGKDMVPTGISEDGLVEAVEVINHPFAVGVQWHPEDMTEHHPEQAAIFAAFVEACNKRSQ
jgi:putative glutamine amidotransferase